MRICSLPKWKQNLYDRINTGPHSWNKVPLIQNQLPLPCVNYLEIDNSLEELGYTRSFNETDSARIIQVQFTKKLMNQILSVDCSKLEMNFKYITKIKPISEISHLNFLNETKVQSTVVNNEHKHKPTA